MTKVPINNSESQDKSEDATFALPIQLAKPVGQKMIRSITCRPITNRLIKRLGKKYKMDIDTTLYNALTYYELLLNSGKIIINKKQ